MRDRIYASRGMTFCPAFQTAYDPDGCWCADARSRRPQESAGGNRKLTGALESFFEWQTEAFRHKRACGSEHPGDCFIGRLRVLLSCLSWRRKRIRRNMDYRYRKQ